MWEKLKKDVKKMVDKKHELETQYRAQRDMHIEVLAKMAADLIQSDIFKSVRMFDQNYLRIYTCGSVHVDNTFKDVSFGEHMDMIDDRIRRNVPDWVNIINVLPFGYNSANCTLVVDYTINEAKVCAE